MIRVLSDVDDGEFSVVVVVDVELLLMVVEGGMRMGMWDQITYPFPNSNGCTVEVWEWINNFISREDYGGGGGGGGYGSYDENNDDGGDNYGGDGDDDG